MNKVCEILGTKLPFVQGPMAALSDADMVTAVSNAGGLGVLVTSVADIETEVDKTKSQTDKPFGLNVIVASEIFEDSDEKATIDLGLDKGINIFVIVSQNENMDAVKYIKENDGIVVYRSQTPSIEAAVLAEKAGADIIVATSYDEGGGYPSTQHGSFALVPTFVDALDIPVLAAGSITDNRGVRAALALGAGGVYVGSALLVAEETNIHENTKQMIIEASSKDMVDFTILGSNFRSLPTPAAKRAHEAHIAGEEEVLGFETLMNGLIAGDFENGIVSVSLAVDRINEVRPTKDIVNGLFEEINF